jgi:hypothetical protein
MTIIDFDIYTGDKFEKTLTLNEDMSGKTLYMTVVDSDGGVFIPVATWIDQTIGRVKFTITDTSSIAIGLGKHDISVDNEETIIKGRIYVEGDV